jgi:hypothetical protein
VIGFFRGDAMSFMIFAPPALSIAFLLPPVQKINMKAVRSGESVNYHPPAGTVDLNHHVIAE